MEAKLALACGVAALSIGAYAQVITPSELKWRAGVFPGTEQAVIEGDPSKPGPFVYRTKFPDGFKIPPHTHPSAERVTVIQGSFDFAEGEKFDQSKLKAGPAGTIIVGGGGAHYAMTKGETIIQLHGQGPWGITFVNPDDDPRKK